jgi:rRNA-processing protein FCF1
VVEQMNSVIIDTNPLVYIYNATPDFGKEFAVLLGKHYLILLVLTDSVVLK